MQQKLDINSDFDAIKQEYEKNKEAYVNTTGDLAKIQLKKKTMLWMISRVLTEVLGKIKTIIQAYKKLFCYNFKTKEYVSFDRVEDPRVAKLFVLANALLDSVLPFFVETLTKVLNIFLF